MNLELEKVKNLKACTEYARVQGILPVIESLMVVRNFPGPFTTCVYLAFGSLFYYRVHTFWQDLKFGFSYLFKYRNMYSKKTLKLWRGQYLMTGKFGE